MMFAMSNLSTDFNTFVEGFTLQYEQRHMNVIDRQYVHLWNVEHNGATSYQYTRETNSFLILTNVTENQKQNNIAFFKMKHQFKSLIDCS